MALIAYLMERKSCYGPHLIIVPNAVMVNWKSELSKVLLLPAHGWPRARVCCRCVVLLRMRVRCVLLA